MKKAAVLASAMLCALTLAGCSAPGNNSVPAADTEPSYAEKAFSEKICTADEALKWASEGSVAVFEELCCVSGKEVWNEFYGSASAGKPASVLCAYYYELREENTDPELYSKEKEQYPKLFFYLVSYDGSEYHVKCRLSSESTPDTDETFDYLLHLTGDNPKTAVRRHYDRYVLVNDPSVTWEQLMQSVFSSQYGDYIKHISVYSDMYD